MICLQSHAIADAVAAGSYTADISQPKASDAGLLVAAWLEGAAGTSMLGRLPTLTQIAETAVFLASDHAGAMTGTVINITAGLVAA